MDCVPNNAANILWALNTKGILTLFEGSTLDGFQFGTSNFVGRPMIDVFENHPSIIDIVRRGLEGESIVSQVILSNLQLSIQCFPLLDTKGNISSLVGIFNNLKKEKTATDEQKSLKTMLATLRGAPNRKQLLLTIMEQVTNLFSAEGVAIAVFFPEEVEATINATSEKWKLMAKKNFSDNFQSYLFQDAQTTFQKNDFAIKSSIYDNHTVIEIPLLAQTKQIGVFWIANKSSLSKNKIRLAMSIAEIIVIGLYNRY
ncbi:MAG: hypothetical protein ABFS03_00065 [Chloroflexota bacterium]